MKDFEKIIWREALTLVDFFSTACGHCHEMRPGIDHFQKTMIGRTDIYHINIDAPEMAEFVNRYNIRLLPTLMFFRRGEVLWRGSGRIDNKQLLSILKELEQQEAVASS